jgi:hypothetical protein
MCSGLTTHVAFRFRARHHGFFLLFHFQRSPLRRSRTAESTPGFRIAAEAFASWLLHLLVVPTAWFHTTSPAFSSSILSALFQRLTTLGFIIVSRSFYAAIPVMHVCPSKLSLRRWPSRQMSEFALLPLRFSASVLGGLLLRPDRHPALLLPRWLEPAVSGGSSLRSQP